MRTHLRFGYLWLLAAVTIVGLVVAACGGGDETPTSVPAPTTAPTRPAATPAPTATPAPPPTPTPVRPRVGGVFTMRVSGAFANEWNAYTGSGQFAVIITQNLLNNITYLEPTDGFTLRPDLAQRWTVAADGKSVTYQIRPGVRWHDGKPFTAADAKYSLDLARSPKDPAASVNQPRLRLVTSIEAPDDATLRITLSNASASFLTIASVASMLIYPAHIPDIAQWKASPVGTGPFKYKSFTKDTTAELVRNDAYFKTDETGSAMPFLSSIQYIWMTDQALALAAYRSGRLNCLCGYQTDLLTTQREQAAESIPGTKFGTGWTGNTLFFNSKPPFDNQKVRQAVHIGLDRIALQTILRAPAEPPTFFLPQSQGGKLSLPTAELLAMPGFRQPKEQDTAMARQLLREAGVDPATVTLKLTINNTQRDFAEAIATLVQGMGFKVNTQLLAAADLSAALGRGDFDLGTTGGGQTFDDPADQIAGATASDGPANRGKFKNARVDELLKAQEIELDQAKRIQLIYDLQRELLTWAVFVPAHTISQLYALAPYVEGFPVNRAFAIGAHHRLERVWLNR